MKKVAFFKKASETHLIKKSTEYDTGYGQVFGCDTAVSILL